MAKLILFNKPFNVLSQFTDKEGRATLADYIKEKNVYPIGRLDYDSEGLLLLTDSGQLKHQIAHPSAFKNKTYWVQVEGDIGAEAVAQLSKGVKLKDGPTRPAKVKKIQEPPLWERVPPIRERKNQATSWLELVITEGRNRQVRRMTAHVGHPTLRLIRIAISDWELKTLMPGELVVKEVHLPKPGTPKRKPRTIKGKHGK